MHVCKSTIQDYEKKYFKKSLAFLAKLKIFVVLPKFDHISNFQKFKKYLVKKGLNQQKNLLETLFRAPWWPYSQKPGKSSGFSKYFFSY
jgi:hypothetical protein